MDFRFTVTRTDDCLERERSQSLRLPRLWNDPQLVTVGDSTRPIALDDGFRLGTRIGISDERVFDLRIPCSGAVFSVSGLYIGEISRPVSVETVRTGVCSIWRPGSGR